MIIFTWKYVYKKNIKDTRLFIITPNWIQREKKIYRNKNPLNKSITQTQGCRKFKMVNHECLVFNKQEVHSGTKIYNSSRAGNIPIVLAISPISVDQNHRNLIF